MCRWKLEELIVDVMPPVSDVLGFSNQWYPRAIETSQNIYLPRASGDPIELRIITAPCFLATKLEAFGGRGQGDYLGSHDMEDIIALVDGRSSLLEELEAEPEPLRAYVARELSRHLPAGLFAAVPGHLAGDAGSQGRAPFVRCVLDRLRRHPRLLKLAQAVQSDSAGQPGGNGPSDLGPWRYEVLSVERRTPHVARAQVVVHARVTNLAQVVGTVGDGRNLYIEDAKGALVTPSRKLQILERSARRLLAESAPAAPDEPIETCWVYELPREARALRLLLPFEHYELPLPGGGG